MLDSVEAFYLEAFKELTTGRNQDGRIPWRDIQEYAERREFDEDVQRIFQSVMRYLEGELRRWLDAEADRKRRAVT